MLPSFEAFGRVFYSYPLLAGIGIIVAYAMVCRYGPLRGVFHADFLIASLVAAIPTLVGAHLVFGLTNADVIVGIVTGGEPLSTQVREIAVCFDGIVFYGGVLAAMLAFFLWVRHEHPGQMGDYLDLLAVAIPLFHTFARIGCFLGGCCFGIPFTPGITYVDDPIAQANGVSRFPVQLLEATGEFVLFLAMRHAYLMGQRRGHLAETWLGSYAVLRFFDEFLRGDLYRGFLGPFSTSQWISLAILAVLAVRYARSRRAGRGMALAA